MKSKNQKPSGLLGTLAMRIGDWKGVERDGAAITVQLPDNRAGRRLAKSKTGMRKQKVAA